MKEKNKEKRYGDTELQKKIIKLGEKNKLTVGSIIDLFQPDEIIRVQDEINRLHEMRLVKYDKETVNDDGSIKRNTRLIWIPKKGEIMPLDIGEVIHGPVADFIYEKENQFYLHFHQQKCQLCEEKIKDDDIRCISLHCEVNFDEDDKISGWTHPYDMVVLCHSCLDELRTRLNIPTQDNLSNF